MKKPLTLLITIFTITVSGQNIQTQDPTNFIPEGYVLFETINGDLDNDGIDDSVLIIKGTDENRIITDKYRGKLDRNRRGIIVLLDKGAHYELVVKNHECFSSENENGGVYFPPELWLDIKNGDLYIHYGHGRYGFWGYTFRFQNSNFELIGYDQGDHRGPYIEREISINFLTKKKLIRENTYRPKNEKDIKEVFEETWSEITIENLLKLSEITDFDKLDMRKY